ncbi:MAG: serine/threonine-protein kinase, partial [Myxococcota bacterium]
MDEDQPTFAMPADPLIGRVLHDRYRIVKALASGGMGRVYLAEQLGLDRTVAIKVLAVDPTDVGRRFHDRFFREAKSVSRLTHPNTVRIYDYGQTDDDVYYIAMEYLEGRTLGLILQEAPLDPLRAIAIASQVCASLSEAHGLGLVHRDLKPANLIVTATSDRREFVRVVDFGIAKDTRTGDLPTQAGLVYGSPGYMSPEQILEQPITPRSDIYSLGAILYRMLTGTRPFGDASAAIDLARHVVAKPMTFAAANPGVKVAATLEWVTLQCLAKDPADRFGSAVALAEALKVCELELRGILAPVDLEPTLRNGSLVLPPPVEEQIRRYEGGAAPGSASGAHPT